MLDDDLNVVAREKILIKGAQRLDPWVLKNCPHLCVKDCEREGIDFLEVVSRLSSLIHDKQCTLVAHNIEYDWVDVMVRTAQECGIYDDPSFCALKNCRRFCTCVNNIHKQEGSAYFYKKIGRWIGPSLKNLAASLKIDYDETAAHDALYDVDVTHQCFLKKICNSKENVAQKSLKVWQNVMYSLSY